MTVATRPSAKIKRRIHATEAITVAAIALAMIVVHLAFFFWPFRYRMVHPLLEQVFQSKVTVTYYHRTYFPHPGFVAEGVTFYRHGDTRIPPLAKVKRMTVAGQWGMLLFHPHLLYEIRLEDLHVQIPPAGTKARGMDFDNGVVDTSQSKLKIETICADGTVLDFLRHGDSPIRFEFPALQIHDLEAGRPMQFALRVKTPGPQGIVLASGKMGPFRTNSYLTTPLDGTYQLQTADLSHLQGLAGHVQGGGWFSGKFSRIEVEGTAAIPDFRADDANQVRLDAQYQAAVNGMTADVQIENAQVKTGTSLITAKGTIAGSPKRVAVTFATQGAEMQDLLRIVEKAQPQMAGKVNFNATAEFGSGPERFLQRLQLKGDVALEGMRFVEAKKQQKMDAFTARVSKNGRRREEVRIRRRRHSRRGPRRGSIRERPIFRIYARTLPGADAHLHGTFNLLDTKVHLEGKIALQQGISHATTGVEIDAAEATESFLQKEERGSGRADSGHGDSSEAESGGGYLLKSRSPVS